jgi:hypothetical protein
MAKQRFDPIIWASDMFLGMDFRTSRRVSGACRWYDAGRLAEAFNA